MTHKDWIILVLASMFVVSLIYKQKPDPITIDDQALQELRDSITQDLIRLQGPDSIYIVKETENEQYKKLLRAIDENFKNNKNELENTLNAIDSIDSSDKSADDLVRSWSELVAIRLRESRKSKQNPVVN